MKLEKAIEIAQIEEASDFTGITYDYEDAIRLLIEAGKEVMKCRRGDPSLDGELLPGETE